MHTLRNVLSIAALLAWISAAAAQDLTIKSPPQRGRIVIDGATVHPISGPVIERGVVVFENGKITEVRPIRIGSDLIGGDARVIRADGTHLYPGLIGAHTQMGLVEFPPVRPTVDHDETGAVTPEVRAVTAVNPDSTILPVTRAAGVLVCGVFPTGGPISGTAGVVQLEGWTPDEMTVRPEVGIAVDWPMMRTVRAWWMEKSDEEQLKDIRRNVALIEDAFTKAAAYAKERAADPSRALDLRWEQLAKTMTGPDRLRVFIRADDFDQISAALDLAGRFGLRVVVIGGRDAPLAAELLKKHDVSVIVPTTFAFPRRADAAYDEAYTLPSRLEAAGLRWCLAQADDTAHERNLPYGAALAAAHGLPREAALRAVTLSAAEILGVADRVGSVEVGKDATMILTDGDPLEISTHVVRAFVSGREIDLSNKHSRLAEKYREKYRQSSAPAPR
ncbi:MAG: amidohydrolase family protein [Phycisphaerae bacterium]|nr:amidohydrolase family protein [Phycisphaerae bacterium]